MVKHFSVKSRQLSDGLVKKQKVRIKANRRGKVGVGDREVPQFEKEKNWREKEPKG